MRLLFVPVLLGAATALHSQVVITVDDDHPLAADFTSLPAAVAAAPEGATILVRQGAYQAFSIVDKELVVTAELGAVAAVFGPSSVANLAPGKTLVLHGLRFSNNNFSNALAIQGCAGTVWIEDVLVETTGSTSNGGATVRIEDSLVVLSRSTIERMEFFSPTNPLTAALHASGSTVQLFETQVTGGLGGHSALSSGAGGIALSLDGGFLFAASSTIQGGQGGQAGTTVFGCDGQTSGMGGAGLVLAGGAEVHLLGGTHAGGAGGVALGSCTVGPAGPASEIVAGTLAAVAWPAHGFDVASPVLESEGATATFSGPSGEFAWYLFSDASQTLFLPQVLGTLVLDFPLFLVPVGTLDAEGEAQVALAPALAPGVESQGFLLQSLFLDTGTGAFTLSSPASLLVLADGF